MTCSAGWEGDAAADAAVADADAAHAAAAAEPPALPPGAVGMVRHGGKGCNHVV